MLIKPAFRHLSEIARAVVARNGRERAPTSPALPIDGATRRQLLEPGRHCARMAITSSSCDCPNGRKAPALRIGIDRGPDKDGQALEPTARNDAASVGVEEPEPRT